MEDRERQFIDKIDCKFPYHNRQESLRLIAEAAALSPAALFAVMEELCSLPFSDRATVATETLLDLLAAVADKLQHPLKNMIVEVAQKMILGQDIPVDEAIAKMQVVQQYPHQYGALNILYFSCDDVEERLEPVCDRIRRAWEA